MDKLHLELNNENFVPKEGQRDSECSNKDSFRCPSLGFNENDDIEEKTAKQLSEILFNKYLLWKKKQL
ncbi:MAG: hypothetical protein QG630_485 [Patescibacteria group bacterium]|nr:hypothetical protein [Patescibacteria group bacterium]